MSDFEDSINLFEKYYGSWSGREKIDPKRSYGIVEFYFPDPGREYGRWTGRKNTTDMYDIPLYREPEGEIFDALQFNLRLFKISRTEQFFREYLSRKVKSEYTAIADESFYLVSTKNGSSFQPYELRHGEESAMIDVENQIGKFLDEKYHTMPGYQKCILYRLWFRTYGEWKDGWYNILLDEKNGTKAYIRKDEARTCFLDWKEEFRRDRVSFPGHELYDTPEGKIIEIDDREKSHYVISRIEGDWMCVSKNRLTQESGWLRWRDDNGILPGIEAFWVIY
ncbi:MAG: hypothetical protein LBV74_21955 [Tannerella sp.]|jgi:hypothetical protein|nr:hypothetical protein [Tannerella sp.]